MKKIKFLLLLLLMVAIMTIASGCKFVRSPWHEHSFDIKYDEDTHYTECACGEKTEEEPHKYKWIVDKAATETKTGLTHRECEVCKQTSFENTVTSILDCNVVYADYTVDGDMQPPAPFFNYSIFVEKDKHAYEEKFDIYVRDIFPNYTYAIKEGSFSIKLEGSPYFEIIGESECSISDYKLNDTDNKLEFKFTVKPVYPCNFTEWFVFKIKCEYDREKTEEIAYNSGAIGCNFDEEYFFTIKDLLYINDSEGMILGEHASNVFYDSLNREFASGVIDSKPEYMNKVFEFESNDSPFIRVYDNNSVVYQSKNIKASLSLKQEYSYLYEHFQQKNSELNKDIAKTVVRILWDNNVISTQTYENELRYIESREIRIKNVDILYSNIAFDDFKWGDMPEYVYVQKDEGLTSNCPRGNETQLSDYYSESFYEYYYSGKNNDVDNNSSSNFNPEIMGWEDENLA